MSIDIQPNEIHVLKAVAWDTLYAMADMTAEGFGESKGQKKQAAALKEIMDNTMEAAADKLSNPETWEPGESHD